jgi:hypothetical protein
MNSDISDTKYVTLYKALRVGRPVRPLLPVDSLRQQTVDQIVKIPYTIHMITCNFYLLLYPMCKTSAQIFLILALCFSHVE